MTIAMVIVLVFYLSVLVATLGVVSSSYLADHPDLQYTPLYAAAALLPSLTFLPPLISIAAVLALVTTMIVTMALASHTVCTCSENGVLPAVLGRTTTNGVPVAATIIITVITAIFAAFPQLTDILINFGALCNVIVVAIVCITVMASRNHQPTLLTDTFRAPGGTALPIITLLVLVASYIPSILQGGWKLWAVTALYYVLGMLLYGKRRPLS
jgi:APA family basic amino acid/polyamine antiporter